MEQKVSFDNLNRETNASLMVVSDLITIVITNAARSRNSTRGLDFSRAVN